MKSHYTMLLNSSLGFDVLESAFLDGEGFEEAENLYREVFRCGESFTIADRPADLHCMLWCLEENGMSKEQAMQAINTGVRFFETCNYKGEEEGFVTEKQGAQMRVFLSRHNYI